MSLWISSRQVWNRSGREKLGANVASGQEARIYPQNVDLRGRFGPTAGFPGRGNDGGRAGALAAEPGRETSKGALKYRACWAGRPAPSVHRAPKMATGGRSRRRTTRFRPTKGAIRSRWCSWASLSLRGPPSSGRPAGRGPGTVRSPKVRHCPPLGTTQKVDPKQLLKPYLLLGKFESTPKHE